VIGLEGPVKAVARKVGIRRATLSAFRTQFERRALAATRRPSATAAGRILCYHSVGTPRWGVNDVSPRRFRRHIEQVLRLGYTFVPAAKIAHGKGGPNDVAITFDDGLLSVATTAAPILDSYSIPWTLFVVGGWIDGRHDFGEGVIMGWAEVQHLAARGVEIGSHSMSHPDFGALEGRAAYIELVESRRLIEARTGLQTRAFAIPLGQSTNWSPEAQSAAGEAGYQLVYAQSVRNRPQGTVPRTFVTRGDDTRMFKAALEGAFDGWEERL